MGYCRGYEGIGERFDGIERVIEDRRYERWASGCREGVNVHASNCKRATKRIASWFMGFVAKRNRRIQARKREVRDGSVLTQA